MVDTLLKNGAKIRGSAKKELTRSYYEAKYEKILSDEVRRRVGISD